VLALSGGDAVARAALAMIQLSESNFVDGLAGFEARLETPGLAAFKPVGTRLPPLTLAGSLAGKRVLLAAEQGQGDTLQFVRYARLLADHGASVLVEAQAPLVPLLANMAGLSGVSAQGAAVPEADFVCPMMSLPLVFGTRVDTIPARVPYLAAPADRRAAWAARLGPATRGAVLGGQCRLRRGHVPLRAAFPVGAAAGGAGAGIVPGADRAPCGR